MSLHLKKKKTFSHSYGNTTYLAWFFKEEVHIYNSRQTRACVKLSYRDTSVFF